jgi:hypothetical protein
MVRMHALAGLLVFQHLVSKHWLLFAIHKNFFPGLQGLTKLRYLNLSSNSLAGSNILESPGNKLACLKSLTFKQYAWAVLFRTHLQK